MARQFGTVSDWLNLGNDTALTPPSGAAGLNMTVCAFVYLTGSATINFIVGRTGYTGSAGGWGYKLISGTNAPRFTKYGIVDLTGGAQFAPPMNQWAFVGACVGSTGVRFFMQPVGGSPVTGAVILNAANFDQVHAPNAAEIGVERSASQTLNPFEGSIYGVRVWIGQQLTDAQFQQLANGASAASVQSGVSGEWMMASPGASPEPDTSGNGFPGTVNGTTVVADPVFGSTINLSPSAGIRLAGAASTTRSMTRAASGGVVLGGAASSQRVKAYVRSGGLVLGGSTVTRFLGPINLTAPVVSGSLVQGQVLTCTPGTWQQGG